MMRLNRLSATLENEADPSLWPRFKRRRHRPGESEGTLVSLRRLSGSGGKRSKLSPDPPTVMAGSRDPDRQGVSGRGRADLPDLAVRVFRWSSGRAAVAAGWSGREGGRRVADSVEQRGPGDLPGPGFGQVQRDASG